MADIAELRIAYPVDTRDAERLALEHLAEAMVRINVDWFRVHPDAPCCLSCGGVEYEDPRLCGVGVICQSVETAPALLARRRGTCLSLAAYAAAKARLKGHACAVAVAPLLDQRDRPIPQAWHAVVVYRDGSIQDPTNDLLAARAEAPRTADAPCACEAQ